jgi:DNA-binding MarR family transcriptional regulator
MLFKRQLSSYDCGMQLLSIANKSTVVPGDRCAGDVLNVAPRVVREIRQWMRDYRLPDLSVPQFRTLALLCISPKVSLSAVADYVGLSLPAASRMVDGLVARKLVARHACSDDRRQVSLKLTPRGASAFRASRQATRKQLADRLKTLNESQLEVVSQAMQFLADVFGTDGDFVATLANPQNHKPAKARAAK